MEIEVTFPDSWQNVYAILGHDDRAAVAAIVGRPLTDEQWAAVVAAIDDPQAQLDALHRSPRRYDYWHQQTIAYLHPRLQQARWQAVFDRVFWRWGCDLVNRDTAQLKQLLTQVTAGTITPRGEAIARYLQTAVLAREGQPEAAITRCDALLAAAIDPDIALKLLNVRAFCHRLLGQPEAAQEGYEQTLALSQTMGDRFVEACTALNLGVLMNSLQYTDRSRTYLQTALAIFRELDRPEWVIRTENNLGIIYTESGMWDDALTAFAGVAQGSVAAELLSINALNIGTVQLLMGHIDEAIHTLTQALAQFQTPAYQVDCYLYLGLAEQVGGNYRVAQTMYSAALQSAEEIGRAEVLPAVHFRLGDVAHRLDAHNDALAHWQTAAAIVETSRAPIKDEAMRIGLLGRWQQIYEAIVLLLVEMDETAAAFAWTERARARAFAEAVSDDAISTATLADVQGVLRPDEQLISYFTTGVLAHDIPMMAQIPKTNRLRDHLILPAKIVRFSVGQTSAAVTICPLDPNAFSSKTPRANDALRFLDPRLAPRLTAALLADLVPADTIIIPHGPLHSVPFTALLAAHSGTIAYTPNATILHQQRQSTAAPAPPHLIVHAWNGDGAEIAQLHYAEREAAVITQQMSGTRTTTAAQLREKAADARYLHLACHGWFDHADPMASYLEIGAGEKLTAREVLEGWSLSAVLVTLSACKTGTSKILRGDEPMGLIRAFLYAGARSVLVSTWAVDDLATFLLMRDLYRRLDAGERPSIALAHAQKWLREASHERLQAQLDEMDVTAVLPVAERPYAAPVYWAAFILVGD